MRATKIKIRNLFGIREAELTAGDYELTGTNGAGKSSILDAIRVGLTNKSDRDYIIRKGESEGEIIIETDTGLAIDRKFRREGSDYKSVKQGSNNVGSPEAFLRSIVTNLQLNPVEFLSMDRKKQNATILDMIQYDWNLDTIRGWFGELPDVNYEQNILAVLNDIQAENGRYFQERQDINRRARNLRAVVDETAAGLPIGYDVEQWRNKSLSDIYTEIEQKRAANARIESARRFMAGLNGKIRGLEGKRDIALGALDREFASRESEINERMVQIRAEFDALKAEKAGLAEKKADKTARINAEHERDVANLNAQREQYEADAALEYEDISDLSKVAKEAETMKSFVRVWDQMKKQEADIEELVAQSDVLTQKIEKARNLPGEILENCTLPVENLSVVNGVPLINGLPIGNLSDGQKLDLCVDIAIANPSGFQIVLLDGVEKLSSEMRTHLYEKCKAKGIQFIATRTTDESELLVTEL